MIAHTTLYAVNKTKKKLRKKKKLQSFKSTSMKKRKQMLKRKERKKQMKYQQLQYKFFTHMFLAAFVAVVVLVFIFQLFYFVFYRFCFCFVNNSFNFRFCGDCTFFYCMHVLCMDVFKKNKRATLSSSPKFVVVDVVAVAVIVVLCAQHTKHNIYNFQYSPQFC